MTPYVKPRFPQHCEYLVLDEIEDNQQQNILRFLPQAIKWIQQALSKESARVLVHCAAGRSRSGAFCAAYMIIETKKSVEEVIKMG